MLDTVKKRILLKYQGNERYNSFEITVYKNGEKKWVDESVAKQLLRDYPSQWEVIKSRDVAQEDTADDDTDETSKKKEQSKVTIDNLNKKVIRKR